MAKLVLEDEDDRLCSHIFGEEHLKAGQRCGGFRTTTSEFCNFHSGGAQQVALRKSQQAHYRKEILEKLELEYHKLRTPQDVLSLLELIVNAVCADATFLDRGKLLALLLPTAYKMTKEIQAQEKGGSTFALEFGKDGGSLKAEFQTAEQLDAFLKANESMTITIMEQMHQTGHLKKSAKPTVTIPAKNVDLDKQRIKNSELAEMSEKTSVPLTTKQATSLFGRYLGEKTKLPRGFDFKGDSQGFDHVWEELPEEAKPVKHDWYKIYEPTGLDPQIQILKFRCRHCGLIEKEKNNSVCYDPTEKQ